MAARAEDKGVTFVALRPPKTKTMEVRRGEIGELLVAGLQVALGYWRWRRTYAKSRGAMRLR